MKIYFFMISLTVFLLSSVELSAKKQEDVVYLKTGSIIRGTVVEMIPDESLKIQTKDGSLFVFDLEDVQKILKDSAALRPRQVFNKSKGYFGLVQSEFGLNLYRGEFTMGATIINGYRVSPLFASGIGVGLRYRSCSYSYSYPNYYSWIPIFVHLRTDLLKGYRISPFIALNIGYNIRVNGRYTIPSSYSHNTYLCYQPKGLMIEPSIGLGFNLGEKYRMTAGVGFSADTLEYYYEQEGRRTIDYGSAIINNQSFSLKFKLGFSF